MDDNPVFVQLPRILIPIDFNLWVWNSLCWFIWCRWIMKKISQKSAEYIGVKKSWNSEKSKNFIFFRFSRFFLLQYIHWIFVKLFFQVHLHHMNKHKEFHTYRLKPIRNNIRGIGQKRENRPKIWLFPIFTIFFTPIYSADFCETFFHGSLTPYEQT